MSKLKENLQAIAAEKAKIKAEDLPSTTTLFGIQGTLDILDGINYVNAKEQLMHVNEETKTVAIQGNSIGKKAIVKSSYQPGVKCTFNDICFCLGIIPEKIVKGETILGTVGTGETNIPFEEEAEYAECLNLTNEILGIGGNE